MKTAVTIFSSIQLGPYTLPNRMVMAPLTRNRAGEGNVPQPLNVGWCANGQGRPCINGYSLIAEFPAALKCVAD